MDLYSFSLTLGGAGLGVMGAIGLGHVAGGTHGAAHGHGHHAGNDAGHHAGHAPAHHAGHHGHAHHGHADGATHAHTEPTFGELARGAAWSLLSPRVAFSLLVGFGAAGMLLGHVEALPSIARLPLALLAGVVFERYMVRPVWDAFFGFASRPAATLEHAIMDEARAVSRFDQNGQGLVALELDGQVVQVLATLRADDRAAGVRVRAGDRVRVEDVDATRHRCTVTRIG